MGVCANYNSSGLFVTQRCSHRQSSRPAAPSLVCVLRYRQQIRSTLPQTLSGENRSVQEVRDGDVVREKLLQHGVECRDGEAHGEVVDADIDVEPWDEVLGQLLCGADNPLPRLALVFLRNQAIDGQVHVCAPAPQ